MNRAGVFLLVLLLLQLALVTKLYWPGNKAGTNNISALLADTGPFLVDELRIEDGRDSNAVLQKLDGRWQLPQLDGLPADSARAEQVVEQLTQQDPGWAVAHTLAARQRFQVANYHFRRKLTLLAQNQPISTVYLGTSPGFRKVHARNDEQDAIYSISLNLFDVPAQDDQWLDRGLLQVRAPLRIIADGYSLDRSTGDWLLGTGARPEPRELAALLEALQNLQVDGVASAEQLSDLKGQEAELILQVVSLAGTFSLELFQLESQHFIRSSTHAQLFRLSGYTYDQLTGIDAFLLSGAQ
jgi:uncharacterized protein DUF4340